MIMHSTQPFFINMMLSKKVTLLDQFSDTRRELIMEKRPRIQRTPLFNLIHAETEITLLCCIMKLLYQRYIRAPFFQVYATRGSNSKIESFEVQIEARQ